MHAPPKKLPTRSSEGLQQRPAVLLQSLSPPLQNGAVACHFLSALFSCATFPRTLRTSAQARCIENAARSLIRPCVRYIAAKAIPRATAYPTEDATALRRKIVRTQSSACARRAQSDSVRRQWKQP